MIKNGSIPTKYGTKNEYLNAIRTLHSNNIKVLADTVLNHKLGADETEEVMAYEDDPCNRNNEISQVFPIQAWTKYYFAGRNNTYSNFKWNWTHFHGVDWDESSKRKSVFKFYGKHWDLQVDTENGNFDYLMGADIDLNNMDVVNELTNWANWYLSFSGIDGFRLDAVKHIRADFFKNWLNDLRITNKKQLFTVGEYWTTNVQTLWNYLLEVDNSMSLFDVPLHYNFYSASCSNGNYDMRCILNGTLLQSNPNKAVTFVDNHDTQPGQALFSWIDDWFKPLAYSIILLRQEGVPCIFYGDYYGIPYSNIKAKSSFLDLLLFVRKTYVYGIKRDYLDDPNIIGWTLEGDIEHPNSGVAVILTDSYAGSKQMNVGRNLSNSILYDYTGNINEPVYVDNDGNAIFYVKEKSVSIWVKKEE